MARSCVSTDPHVHPARAAPAPPRRLCTMLCVLSRGAAAFGARAAAPAAAAAPEALAAQLRDAALAGHDIAYEWVSELTSRFGPRPAGSVSERQAAGWAAARFKELGFENVHIESFPITAWARAGARVRPQQPRCRSDRAARRARAEGARAPVLERLLRAGRAFTERDRGCARARASAGSGAARRAPGQLGPGDRGRRRRDRH